MSRRFAALPSVAEDLQEAKIRLRKRDPRLVRRFQIAFESTIARIRRNPELYAPEEDGLRTGMMKPFRYHVGYLLEPGLIVPVGVFHAHGHPETWATRLPDDE